MFKDSVRTYIARFHPLKTETSSSYDEMESKPRFQQWLCSIGQRLSKVSQPLCDKIREARQETQVLTPINHFPGHIADSSVGWMPRLNTEDAIGTAYGSHMFTEILANTNSEAWKQYERLSPSITSPLHCQYSCHSNLQRTGSLVAMKHTLNSRRKSITDVLDEEGQHISPGTIRNPNPSTKYWELPDKLRIPIPSHSFHMSSFGLRMLGI